MLSSSSIMALQKDLCYLRNHLRELRTRKDEYENKLAMNWKKQLMNIFSKTHSKQISSLNHAIDKLEAIIHVYSKVLLLARTESKGGNEDDFIISISELDAMFKVEICDTKIQTLQFNKIAKRIELLHSNVTWEKFAEMVLDQE